MEDLSNNLKREDFKVLTVQPKENIIQILEQSKFGRPAKVQHAIQRCIDEIIKYKNEQ